MDNGLPAISIENLTIEFHGTFRTGGIKFEKYDIDNQNLYLYFTRGEVNTQVITTYNLTITVPRFTGHIFVVMEGDKLYEVKNITSKGPDHLVVYFSELSSGSQT